MLPLIPVAIAMTVLMGATLLVVYPEGERKATAALADDMLRYHQAVLKALIETPGTPEADLDEIEEMIDLAPFSPLVVWESALAQEIDFGDEGEEVIVATWVVTWPATFGDSGAFSKSDLAAIPFRLRTSGYNNSRFGSWTSLDLGDAEPLLPEGRVAGIGLRGVSIPDGAPVVINVNF